MPRVLIVEDNPTIREGLAVLLEATEGLECPATFESCEAMLDEAEDLKPDLVLMDIGLPGMSGIEGVRELHEILPEVAVVMLTVYEDNERIFEALLWTHQTKLSCRAGFSARMV